MAREAVSNRVRRSAISDKYRGRLSVEGKDPNYEYRWVNDTDNNVSVRQEQGWEIVTDQDLKIGDKRVADPAELGSARTVSVGNGVTSHLMRIKKEWYDEDQQMKQKRVDELEKSTKPDPRDGFYGKLNVNTK